MLWVKLFLNLSSQTPANESELLVWRGLVSVVLSSWGHDTNVDILVVSRNIHHGSRIAFVERLVYEEQCFEEQVRGTF